MPSLWSSRCPGHCPMVQPWQTRGCAILLLAFSKSDTGLIVCAVVQHNWKRPTQLADDIVERVLQLLKDLGRVPRDFTRSQGRRPAVWMLSSTTDALIGRESEVEVVLTSLRQHGAAVIWGGPGEGKTTIAMEAATRQRAHEPHLSGFVLDMRGERAALMWSRLPWLPIGPPVPRTMRQVCVGFSAVRRDQTCLV